MRTEFHKARLPGDLAALVAFDRKVFSAADRFPADYWKELQAYWMLVEGTRAGCCAFERHTDFQQDLTGDNPKLRGSLYIATTGILPRFQGRGFGRLLKAWQIAYAWQHKFDRIVTNTRKRNKAMIALNLSCGFAILRTTPDHYSNPKDATVVMELRRGIR